MRSRPATSACCTACAHSASTPTRARPSGDRRRGGRSGPTPCCTCGRHSERRRDMSATYTTMASPVGELLLTAEDGRLTGLYLPGGQACPAPRRRPRRHLVRDGAAPARGVLRRRAQRVRRAAAPAGDDFQQRVWEELQRMATARRSRTPARRAHRAADGDRAPGAANGENPGSIVIPCHRVIGSDGTLAGYGGGLDASAACSSSSARRREGTRDLVAARLVLLGAIWGMSSVLIKSSIAASRPCRSRSSACFSACWRSCRPCSLRAEGWSV